MKTTRISPLIHDCQADCAALLEDLAPTTRRGRSPAFAFAFFSEMDALDVLAGRKPPRKHELIPPIPPKGRPDAVAEIARTMDGRALLDAAAKAADQVEAGHMAAACAFRRLYQGERESVAVMLAYCQRLAARQRTVAAHAAKVAP